MAVAWVLSIPQVQLCDQIAVVRDGRVVSASEAGVLAPVLSLRSPAAPVLVAGAAAEMQLAASFLPHEATVLCRSRGAAEPTEDKLFMALVQWMMVSALKPVCEPIRGHHCDPPAVLIAAAGSPYEVATDAIEMLQGGSCRRRWRWRRRAAGRGCSA